MEEEKGWRRGLGRYYVGIMKENKKKEK